MSPAARPGRAPSQGGATLGTLLRRAAVTGMVASATSAVALLALAKAKGRAAVQPINATSHWLHGPAAAEQTATDLAHTGVGYATHHAATLFWAAVFEAWVAGRRPLRPVPLARDAAAMATVAAAVDYLATPKRFTPGWELVLSRGAMTAAYATLAVGFALGAALADRADVERRC